MAHKDILFKKISLFLLSFLAFSIFAIAQKDSTAVAQDNQVVTEMFAGGTLISQQTCVQAPKGGLEFIINHRFGEFKNGSKDIWGIYAPSNIRIGINYGITDKIMIGVGTEKSQKLNDFNLKVALLQQTGSLKMPVSVTYFGSMTINAKEKSEFGTVYNFKNRLAFFNELIIGRKFTDFFSMQVAPTFTHFNKVDSLFDHDFIGLHAGARYKFNESMSIIFEYNTPLKIQGMQEYKPEILKNEYRPSMGLGLEIGTSTHCFQVFVSNSYDIIAQRMYAYNSYKMDQLMLGFNITVRL